MDLSFQEKSILGSLLITVCLFGGYFFSVFEAFTSNSSDAIATLPGVLAGVVLAVIAVEIVYHIAIAMVVKDEGTDERDRLIEAYATRFSYYFLVFGMICSLGYLLFVGSTEGFLQSVPAHAISAHAVVVAINLMVFSFIGAEVIGFAMQLYYYRRGV